MNSLCLLLTDDKSINDLIIKKSYDKLKKNKFKKIYIIGDKRKFKLSYNISKKIKNIEFINIIKKENFNYLKKITKISIKLFQQKKINYLINMPLNKRKYLNQNYNGFTEFFSSFIDGKNNENMLLYNNKFSVCPVTTHVELDKVEKIITKKKLINTIENIMDFFKKKEKIKIVILGLNPHAGVDFKNKTFEDRIILPVIKSFKKKGVKLYGPKSADTAFNDFKNKVFIGMYHDQVLIPFKLINRFNGINITIGKKLIRLSPDHGTAENLKKLIDVNNQSFLKCIKFCEKN